MKTLLTTAAALLALSTAAFADGDAADGEKDFKKCKSCHAITDPDGEDIVKGGKTGPNLWGVIGRQAGTEPEFEGKYGDSLVAAGEAGLVWTEELLTEYSHDPKAFLADYLDDDKAKSKMTFKLKDSEDVAAYLATFGDGGEEGDS
ncbi:c-type cytochrome [Maritimibacter fusiformis]|uniref:Cytochrome C n=1 Tax=Maritimibacter fusiformis TaxID=2603819 RepID=A0A5D0RR69_9RHOB|nr:cytochrome C [Maritimibacter fusiformis]TYB83071.1 cytochrome C [Maritimibacter fusiformis]